MESLLQEKTFCLGLFFLWIRVSSQFFGAWDFPRQSLLDSLSDLMLLKLALYLITSTSVDPKPGCRGHWFMTHNACRTQAFAIGRVVESSIFAWVTYVSVVLRREFSKETSDASCAQRNRCCVRQNQQLLTALHSGVRPKQFCDNEMIFNYLMLQSLKNMFIKLVCAIM